MAYESEIRVVEAGIAALKGESAVLAAGLASEQRAAATGLEYYGITKSVFERLLRESSVSAGTAICLKSGIDAVQRMFAS